MGEDKWGIYAISPLAFSIINRFIRFYISPIFYLLRERVHDRDNIALQMEDFFNMVARNAANKAITSFDSVPSASRNCKCVIFN